MQSLTYTEEDHSYRLNGRRIPGITQVLGDLGYYKGSGWYTESSRRRGQAVHNACALVDEHCPDATTVEEVLDVLDLGEAVLPYLTGYLLFKAETGYTPLLREQPTFLPDLNIAGRFDSFGQMPNSHVLVDFKTWSPAPTTLKNRRDVEIQTQFYIMGIQTIKRFSSLVDPARIVVCLPGNNSYRAYPIKSNDIGILRCLAAIWWDRQNAGLIESSQAWDETAE
jgi:hypothetical protein